MKGLKGGRRWLETHAVPLRDSEGQITALLGVTRDITERRRAEEALRESRQRVQSILDSMFTFVGVFTPDGIVIDVNRASLEATGLKRDDVIGKPVTQTHPLAHSAVVQQQVRDALRRAAEGEVVRTDVVVRVADGQLITMDVTFSGLKDGLGRVVQIVGSGVDVTERKRAEGALQAAEARLRLAVEAGRIGTWDWDLVSGKIVWSRGHEELWDLPPGGFKGTYEDFNARVHPDDRNGLNTAVANSLSGHCAFRHEFRVVWPGGSVHWIAGQGEPFFDDTGKPVRMLGVVMDIPERRRADEALRDSERTFRTLVKNLPGVAYRCQNDPDWTVIFISEGILPLSGYRPSDFIARKISFGKLIHQDDQESVWNDIQTALQEKRPYQVEYRIRTAAGEERWIWEQGQGIFSEAGELLFLEGFFTDMTERKRADEMLREGERRLRTVVDQVPVVLWSTDTELRFTLSLGAGLAGLGLQPNQVVGKTLFEYFQTNDVDLVPIRAHYQALRGESASFETTWQGRLFESHTDPLRDQRGRIIGVIGIAVDVTDRKRTEEALREQTHRLQGLSKRLAEAQEVEGCRIGRELHDDLGQILTTMKIKLQTLLSVRTSRSFDENVTDLTTTVDQAIERIRTISADLRPAILDDLGLAAALRWMLDRQTQQAGLTGTFVTRGVETRLSPELEATCYRVAQEALTNVVRHARAKHVRIELLREEGDLHLLVRDDGVGFDAETVLSDISHGQSLGLLSMKERVELIDGRFTIRSAYGQGTEVHAWFSLSRAAGST